MPTTLLAEGFRRAALDLLVKNEALADELRRRMLGWRHAGFSVHDEVRVPAEDAEGRKKLAGYMLRAPMSLEKMTYDAATGTVIYRSKMHAGPKRNFQIMPGAAPHRAESAGRSRELAALRQSAAGLSPGSRHRLTCRTKNNASVPPGCGKD